MSHSSLLFNIFYLCHVCKSKEVADLCVADMGSLSADVYMELAYEQRCQSDVIRQTKGSKVLGMAVSPICERRIGICITPFVSYNITCFLHFM